MAGSALGTPPSYEPLPPQSGTPRIVWSLAWIQSRHPTAPRVPHPLAQPAPWRVFTVIAHSQHQGPGPSPPCPRGCGQKLAHGAARRLLTQPPGLAAAPVGKTSPGLAWLQRTECAEQSGSSMKNNTMMRPKAWGSRAPNDIQGWHALSCGYFKDQRSKQGGTGIWENR